MTRNVLKASKTKGVNQLTPLHVVRLRQRHESCASAQKAPVGALLLAFLNQHLTFPEAPPDSNREKHKGCCQRRC